MIVLSLLLQWKISSANTNLLSQKLLETKNADVPKAMELNAAPLQSYTYDYTVWDQMVEFLTVKKDFHWAKEELDLALSNYKIHYIWVVDTNANEYYYSTTSPTIPVQKINIPVAQLKAALEKQPLNHFYLSAGNHLVDVFSAPVQPTTDKERKTKGFGYLMLGRIIDSSYIHDLKAVTTDIRFSVAKDQNAFTDQVDARHGIIKSSIPLTSITGETIAAINITRNFPVLNQYHKYLNTYLIVFILTVILIGAIFYWISRKLLFNPLHTIFNALKEKKSSKLYSLNQSKNEYGELSNLISDFFDQNLLLEQEIESRRQTEIALKKALKEKEDATIEKVRAEQAGLAKSQFLSTMSHEIRTPINGVIGISNLLMEEDLTPKQKEYVKTLNFSAQHLTTIVSDILDFSKIEAGSLQFEKASFSIDNICENVFNLFKNKATEKHIQYTCSHPENKNFSLYGDYVRLSQVLSNLLSNAIKFTDKGSVDFSYDIKEETSNTVTYAFKVKDSGIGIAEDQKKKIFESFSQADDTITRRYGGTGLGLTISKRLVELQNGTITVCSEPGKGSTFTVTLTYDKHSFVNADVNIDEHKAHRKELTGMKILVAEDNHINAMILTRFLSKWKTDAKVANDGREALDLLKNEKFDIVLMDLQMPNLDGMEATKIIRSSDDDTISQIPIVALTADALIDTHRKLMQLGFNYCITKPFNPDALFNYLKKHYNAA